MDILLWVGWACTIAVLFFVTLIGVFGSLTLKASSWDSEFVALARQELTRRGLTDRKRLISVPEELSMQRFIGQQRVAERPDKEFRAQAIGTIAVLVGAEDRTKLQAFLEERSNELLASAMSGVSGSVRNISNLNIASRVWVIRRWTAVSFVLWRGLAWFLPRCFRRVAKSTERYMGVATILGIAGGLLYWGFNRNLSESADGGVAWVNFVGLVVTVGTVIALVAAVGRQFLLVVVSVVGPVRDWTRKGIATATLYILLVATMLTLVWTGAWTQWQVDASKFLTELLTNTPAGDWIGKIFLVTITVFAIYNAIGRVRARRLKIGDRTTAMGAAIVLVLLSAVIILFILGAPKEVAQPAFYAFAFSFLIFGALEATISAVEWIRKYRSLGRAGVEIRQGWFRWWMLWVWSGTALAFLALVSIPPVSLASVTNTVFSWAIPVLTMITFFALLVSFWPGIFAVVRFVIRVHNTYARHEFELAQARFEKSGSADIR